MSNTSILEKIEAAAEEQYEPLAPGTEIDSRELEGHIGSVQLLVIYGGFHVIIRDQNGEVFWHRATEDRVLASQLYLHPFSFPEVPSLWRPLELEDLPYQ